MEIKEYQSQRAVGTIDYRAAALEGDNEVCSAVIDDCTDKDAFFAIAMNYNVNAKTLQRLISHKDADHTILSVAVTHPNVTQEVLEGWMGRAYIRDLDATKQRMYGFQARAGVPTRDRISMLPGDDSTQSLLADLMKNNNNNNYYKKTQNGNICNIYKDYISWDHTTSKIGLDHFKYNTTSTTSGITTDPVSAGDLLSASSDKATISAALKENLTALRKLIDGHK